jgi:uncharacterized membrane protein YkoI
MLEPRLKPAFIRDSEFLQDNGGMTPSLLRSVRLAPVALALLIALLVGMGSTQASGSDDHDRAHSALRAGEVMPLEQVLTRISKDHPGQVLKVELEREDGLWTYEVKLLQADGQLLKLLLDARTGDLLRKRAKSNQH